MMIKLLVILLVHGISFSLGNSDEYPNSTARPSTESSDSSTISETTEQYNTTRGFPAFPTPLEAENVGDPTNKVKRCRDRELFQQFILPSNEHQEDSHDEVPYLKIADVENSRAILKSVLGAISGQLVPETPEIFSDRSRQNRNYDLSKKPKCPSDYCDYDAVALVGKRIGRPRICRPKKCTRRCRKNGCKGGNCVPAVHQLYSTRRNGNPVFLGRNNNNDLKVINNYGEQRALSHSVNNAPLIVRRIFTNSLIPVIPLSPDYPVNGVIPATRHFQSAQYSPSSISSNVNADPGFDDANQYLYAMPRVILGNMRDSEKRPDCAAEYNIFENTMKEDPIDSAFKTQTAIQFQNVDSQIPPCPTANHKELVGLEHARNYSPSLQWYPAITVNPTMQTFYNIEDCIRMFGRNVCVISASTSPSNQNIQPGMVSLSARERSRTSAYVLDDGLNYGTLGETPSTTLQDLASQGNNADFMSGGIEKGQNFAPITQSYFEESEELHHIEHSNDRSNEKMKDGTNAGSTSIHQYTKGQKNNHNDDSEEDNKNYIKQPVLSNFHRSEQTTQSKPTPIYAVPIIGNELSNVPIIAVSQTNDHKTSSTNGELIWEKHQNGVYTNEELAIRPMHKLHKYHIENVQGHQSENEYTDRGHEMPNNQQQSLLNIEFENIYSTPHYYLKNGDYLTSIRDPEPQNNRNQNLNGYGTPHFWNHDELQNPNAYNDFVPTEDSRSMNIYEKSENIYKSIPSIMTIQNANELATEDQYEHQSTAVNAYDTTSKRFNEYKNNIVGSKILHYGNEIFNGGGQSFSTENIHNDETKMDGTTKLLPFARMHSNDFDDNHAITTDDEYNIDENEDNYSQSTSDYEAQKNDDIVGVSINHAIADLNFTPQNPALNRVVTETNSNGPAVINSDQPGISTVPRIIINRPTPTKNNFFPKVTTHRIQGDREGEYTEDVLQSNIDEITPRENNYEIRREPPDMKSSSERRNEDDDSSNGISLSPKKLNTEIYTMKSSSNSIPESLIRDAKLEKIRLMYPKNEDEELIGSVRLTTKGDDSDIREVTNSYFTSQAYDNYKDIQENEPSEHELLLGELEKSRSNEKYAAIEQPTSDSNESFNSDLSETADEPTILNLDEVYTPSIRLHDKIKARINDMVQKDKYTQHLNEQSYSSGRKEYSSTAIEEPSPRGIISSSAENDNMSETVIPAEIRQNAGYYTVSSNKDIHSSVTTADSSHLHDYSDSLQGNDYSSTAIEKPYPEDIIDLSTKNDEISKTIVPIDNIENEENYSGSSNKEIHSSELAANSLQQNDYSDSSEGNEHSSETLEKYSATNILNSGKESDETSKSVLSKTSVSNTDSSEQDTLSSVIIADSLIQDSSDSNENSDGNHRITATSKVYNSNSGGNRYTSQQNDGYTIEEDLESSEETVSLQAQNLVAETHAAEPIVSGKHRIEQQSVTTNDGFNSLPTSTIVAQTSILKAVDSIQVIGETETSDISTIPDSDDNLSDGFNSLSASTVVAQTPILKAVDSIQVIGETETSDISSIPDSDDNSSGGFNSLSASTVVAQTSILEAVDSTQVIGKTGTSGFSTIPYSDDNSSDGFNSLSTSTVVAQAPILEGLDVTKVIGETATSEENAERKGVMYGWDNDSDDSDQNMHFPDEEVSTEIPSSRVAVSLLGNTEERSSSESSSNIYSPSDGGIFVRIPLLDMANYVLEGVEPHYTTEESEKNSIRSNAYSYTDSLGEKESTSPEVIVVKVSNSNKDYYTDSIGNDNSTRMHDAVKQVPGENVGDILQEKSKYSKDTDVSRISTSELKDSSMETESTVFDSLHNQNQQDTSDSDEYYYTDSVENTNSTQMHDAVEHVPRENVGDILQEKSNYSKNTDVSGISTSELKDSSMETESTVFNSLHNQNQQDTSDSDEYYYTDSVENTNSMPMHDVVGQVPGKDVGDILQEKSTYSEDGDVTGMSTSVLKDLSTETESTLFNSLQNQQDTSHSKENNTTDSVENINSTPMHNAVEQVPGENVGETSQGKPTYSEDADVSKMNTTELKDLSMGTKSTKLDSLQNQHQQDTSHSNEDYYTGSVENTNSTPMHDAVEQVLAENIGDILQGKSTNSEDADESEMSTSELNDSSMETESTELDSLQNQHEQDTSHSKETYYTDSVENINSTPTHNAVEQIPGENVGNILQEESKYSKDTDVTGMSTSKLQDLSTETKSTLLDSLQNQHQQDTSYSDEDYYIDAVENTNLTPMHDVVGQVVEEDVGDILQGKSTYSEDTDITGMSTSKLKDLSTETESTLFVSLQNQHQQDTSHSDEDYYTDSVENTNSTPMHDVVGEVLEEDVGDILQGKSRYSEDADVTGMSTSKLKDLSTKTESILLDSLQNQHHQDTFYSDEDYYTDSVENTNPTPRHDAIEQAPGENVGDVLPGNGRLSEGTDVSRASSSKPNDSITEIESALPETLQRQQQQAHPKITTYGAMLDTTLSSTRSSSMNTPHLNEGIDAPPHKNLPKSQNIVKEFPIQVSRSTMQGIQTPHSFIEVPETSSIEKNRNIYTDLSVDSKYPSTGSNFDELLATKSAILKKESKEKHSSIQTTTITISHSDEDHYTASLEDGGSTPTHNVDAQVSIEDIKDFLQKNGRFSENTDVPGTATLEPNNSIIKNKPSSFEILQSRQHISHTTTQNIGERFKLSDNEINLGKASSRKSSRFEKNHNKNYSSIEKTVINTSHSNEAYDTDSLEIDNRTPIYSIAVQVPVKNYKESIQENGILSDTSDQSIYSYTDSSEENVPASTDLLQSIQSVTKSMSISTIIDRTSSSMESSDIKTSNSNKNLHSSEFKHSLSTQKTVEQSSRTDVMATEQEREASEINSAQTNTNKDGYESSPLEVILGKDHAPEGADFETDSDNNFSSIESSEKNTANSEDYNIDSEEEMKPGETSEISSAQTNPNKNGYESSPLEVILGKDHAPEGADFVTDSDKKYSSIESSEKNTANLEDYNIDSEEEMKLGETTELSSAQTNPNKNGYESSPLEVILGKDHAPEGADFETDSDNNYSSIESSEKNTANLEDYNIDSEEEMKLGETTELSSAQTNPNKNGYESSPLEVILGKDHAPEGADFETDSDNNYSSIESSEKNTANLEDYNIDSEEEMKLGETSEISSAQANPNKGEYKSSQLKIMLGKNHAPERADFEKESDENYSSIESSEKNTANLEDYNIDSEEGMKLGETSEISSAQANPNKGEYKSSQLKIMLGKNHAPERADFEKESDKNHSSTESSEENTAHSEEYNIEEEEINFAKSYKTTSLPPTNYNHPIESTRNHEICSNKLCTESSNSITNLEPPLDSNMYHLGIPRMSSPTTMKSNEQITSSQSNFDSYLEFSKDEDHTQETASTSNSESFENTYSLETPIIDGKPGYSGMGSPRITTAEIDDYSETTEEEDELISLNAMNSKVRSKKIEDKSNETSQENKDSGRDNMTKSTSDETNYKYSSTPNQKEFQSRFTASERSEYSSPDHTQDTELRSNLESSENTHSLETPITDRMLGYSEMGSTRITTAEIDDYSETTEEEDELISLNAMESKVRSKKIEDKSNETSQENKDSGRYNMTKSTSDATNYKYSSIPNQKVIQSRFSASEKAEFSSTTQKSQAAINEQQGQEIRTYDNSKYTTPETSDKSMPKSSYTVSDKGNDKLLVSMIKNVMNNFVPVTTSSIKSSELTTDTLETMQSENEELLPQIINTPMLRKLFASPTVENMVINSVKSEIARLGSPEHSEKSEKTDDIIRAALRNVVEGIGESLPTDYPIVVQEHHLEKGTWVTENVTLLPTVPPEEREKPRLGETLNEIVMETVRDALENIVGSEPVGLSVSKNPIIENIVVSAVHDILKSKTNILEEQIEHSMMKDIVRNAIEEICQERMTVTKVPKEFSSMEHEYESDEQVPLENDRLGKVREPNRNEIENTATTLRSPVSTATLILKGIPDPDQQEKMISDEYNEDSSTFEVSSRETLAETKPTFIIIPEYIYTTTGRNAFEISSEARAAKPLDYMFLGDSDESTESVSRISDSLEHDERIVNLKHESYKFSNNGILSTTISYPNNLVYIGNHAEAFESTVKKAGHSIENNNYLSIVGQMQEPDYASESFQYEPEERENFEGSDIDYPIIDSKQQFDGDERKIKESASTTREENNILTSRINYPNNREYNQAHTDTSILRLSKQLDLVESTEFSNSENSENAEEEAHHSTENNSDSTEIGQMQEPDYTSESFQNKPEERENVEGSNTENIVDYPIFENEQQFDVDEKKIEGSASTTREENNILTSRMNYPNNQEYNHAHTDTSRPHLSKQLDLVESTEFSTPGEFENTGKETDYSIENNSYSTEIDQMQEPVYTSESFQYEPDEHENFAGSNAKNIGDYPFFENKQQFDVDKGEINESASTTREENNILTSRMNYPNNQEYNHAHTDTSRPHLSKQLDLVESTEFSTSREFENTGKETDYSIENNSYSTEIDQMQEPDYTSESFQYEPDEHENFAGSNAKNIGDYPLFENKQQFDVDKGEINESASTTREENNILSSGINHPNNQEYNHAHMDSSILQLSKQLDLVESTEFSTSEEFENTGKETDYSIENNSYSTEIDQMQELDYTSESFQYEPEEREDFEELQMKNIVKYPVNGNKQQYNVDNKAIMIEDNVSATHGANNIVPHVATQDLTTFYGQGTGDISTTASHPTVTKYNYHKQVTGTVERGPTDILEHLTETSPIKYFSPNDRILEYIKKHTHKNPVNPESKLDDTTEFLGNDGESVLSKGLQVKNIVNYPVNGNRQQYNVDNKAMMIEDNVSATHGENNIVGNVATQDLTTFYGQGTGDISTTASHPTITKYNYHKQVMGTVEREPSDILEHLTETSPIKYFSPNDRILEYIKKHTHPTPVNPESKLDDTAEFLGNDGESVTSEGLQVKNIVNYPVNGNKQQYKAIMVEDNASATHGANNIVPHVATQDLTTFYGQGTGDISTTARHPTITKYNYHKQVMGTVERGPTDILEHLTETSPIKYFSPNDRILEYIKKHTHQTPVNPENKLDDTTEFLENDGESVSSERGSNHNDYIIKDSLPNSVQTSGYISIIDSTAVPTKPQIPKKTSSEIKHSKFLKNKQEDQNMETEIGMSTNAMHDYNDKYQTPEQITTENYDSEQRSSETYTVPIDESIADKHNTGGKNASSKIYYEDILTETGTKAKNLQATHDVSKSADYSNIKLYDRPENYKQEIVQSKQNRITPDQTKQLFKTEEILAEGLFNTEAVHQLDAANMGTLVQPKQYDDGNIDEQNEYVQDYSYEEEQTPHPEQYYDGNFSQEDEKNATGLNEQIISTISQRNDNSQEQTFIHPKQNEDGYKSQKTPTTQVKYISDEKTYTQPRQHEGENISQRDEYDKEMMTTPGQIKYVFDGQRSTPHNIQNGINGRREYLSEKYAYVLPEQYDHQKFHQEDNSEDLVRSEGSKKIPDQTKYLFEDDNLDKSEKSRDKSIPQPDEEEVSGELLGPNELSDNRYETKGEENLGTESRSEKWIKPVGVKDKYKKGEISKTITRHYGNNLKHSKLETIENYAFPMKEEQINRSEEKLSTEHSSTPLLKQSKHPEKNHYNSLETSTFVGKAQNNEEKSTDEISHRRQQEPVDFDISETGTDFSTDTSNDYDSSNKYNDYLLKVPKETMITSSPINYANYDYDSAESMGKLRNEGYTKSSEKSGTSSLYNDDFDYRISSTKNDMKEDTNNHQMHNTASLMQDNRKNTKYNTKMPTDETYNFRVTRPNINEFLGSMRHKPESTNSYTNSQTSKMPYESQTAQININVSEDTAQHENKFIPNAYQGLPVESDVSQEEKLNSDEILDSTHVDTPIRSHKSTTEIVKKKVTQETTYYTNEKAHSTETKHTKQLNHGRRLGNRYHSPTTSISGENTRHSNYVEATSSSSSKINYATQKYSKDRKIIHHTSKLSNSNSFSNELHDVNSQEMVSATENTKTSKESSEILGGSAYFGRISPQNPNSNAESIADLVGSDLYYIGDGVKLPLKITRLKDGSFALSLSEKICEIMMNERCPCCVPPEGNIVRETKPNNRGKNVKRNVASLDLKNESTSKETGEFVFDSFETTERGENKYNSFRKHKRRPRRSTITPVETFTAKYNLTLNLDELSSEAKEDTENTRKANAVNEPKTEEVTSFYHWKNCYDDTRSPRKDVSADHEHSNVIKRSNSNESQNSDLMKKLMSLIDAPQSEKADILVTTLKDLIESEPEKIYAVVSEVEKEIGVHSSISDSKDTDPNSDEDSEERAVYGYQMNNPIMKRIEFIKQKQKEYSESTGEHKYQTDHDEAITKKTKLLNNILHWLKDLVVTAPIQARS